MIELKIDVILSILNHFLHLFSQKSHFFVDFTFRINLFL
jgi:hypothetical protein